MYKNSQNGKIVVSAEQDEKTKTWLLTFEDGKTTSVSPSTFKRWYKKIEPEAGDVDEVMKQKKELGIECPPIETFEVVTDDTAGDGTPLVEVGKEIAKQAKQKAAKAKKVKVSGIAQEDAHKMIIEQATKVGYETIITDKNPKTVWILVNGKKSIGVYVGGKKCVLGMTAAIAPTDTFQADRVRNCPISHSYDIAYDNMDRLGEILSATLNKEDK